LETAIALLLGPLLGHLVRRRRLTPALEWLGLMSAILAGAAMSLLAAWLFGEQVAQMVMRGLDSPVTFTPSTVLGDGLILLWLGGGLALFGYQRERIELASLQKTRDLESLAGSKGTAVSEWRWLRCREPGVCVEVQGVVAAVVLPLTTKG